MLFWNNNPEAEVSPVWNVNIPSHDQTAQKNSHSP